MGWLKLVTALGFLVLSGFMYRAYFRGQTHLVSRLLAAAVLLLAAETTIRFVVDPDRVSGSTLVIMAVLVVVAAVNAVRGGRRAPSR